VSLNVIDAQELHDQQAFSDVLSLLRHKAHTSPDSVAIERQNDAPVNYLSLCNWVEDIAQGLRSQGVSPNGTRSRVAIVLPNGPEMSIALLAVCSIGAALPFNPLYREAEFEDYFQRTGVNFLLVGNDDNGFAPEVAASLGVKVLRLDENGKLAKAQNIHKGSPAEAPIAAPDPDDIALVLLTSGSSGRPKSVPLTHRNICVSAGEVVQSMCLGASDRCLSMWEQFHIGGLVDLLLAPLASGGTIISTSGFNAAEFYRLLADAKPTWFQGVPTTLRELVFHAERNNIAIQPNTLRLVRSVAAALPPRLMEEVEALFSVPVIQTFGMTEAGPLITSTRLPPAARIPGSVGTSCGNEIRILGPDDTALGYGETGEVVVRGDNIFAGYENNVEANSKAFRNGWFFTGDTGYLDEDGQLFLVGRVKQIINRGGEKVNPQEVDDMLLTHPEIDEAATFALKHRTLGEDVGAAIVLRSDASTNEIEILKFLSTRLASFKVPQQLFIQDRLPRNAVGKIDRLALTEAAESKAASVTSELDSDTNALEQRLAKLWASELNLPEVGLDDNFFAIGGDSLSGVRLYLAVEEDLGRPLPQGALTGISTVREMARLVDEAETIQPDDLQEKGEGCLTATERRSLTTVMAMGSISVAYSGSAMKIANGDGRLRPLFWCFNNPAKEMGGLAPHLNPEQPLYGLYSGGRLFTTTEEMLQKLAQHYVDEILSVAPNGPYLIGGNCKGGWIAVRVARILIASGRQVEALCLLEHSDPSLSDFEGRLMFLFGKQSKLRTFRNIGWERSGWSKRFPRKPSIGWVPGRHAHIFRTDNAAQLAEKIERFLAGTPLGSGRAATLESTLIRLMHRIPGMFAIYHLVYRLRDHLLFGRKIKMNPFTGEIEQ